MRAARRALLAMAVAGEVELPFGEMAALALATVIEDGVSLAAVARWGEGADNHLGEIFAGDETLLTRVQGAISAAHET